MRERLLNAAMLEAFGVQRMKWWERALFRLLFPMEGA